MKTEALIDVLSANLQPVDTRQVSRGIRAAVAASAAAATVIMAFAIGLHWDLNGAGILFAVVPKLAFTVAVVALATALLVRLARPGGENRAPLSLISMPFIAVVIVATIGLLLQPGAHWKPMMLMEDRWLECLIAIPAAAVVPFAAVVWAVRRGAPTDLRRTGALIGIVAGGASATGYALHSAEGWLPFVAIWYGSGIALCAFVGATLGPRLLRW